MKKGFDYLRLRAIAKKKLGKRKDLLVKPVKEPRYDKVYYEGLKWLDTL